MKPILIFLGFTLSAVGSYKYLYIQDVGKSESVQVLADITETSPTFIPTLTLTPSVTPIPTVTPMPTPTLLPTPIPQPEFTSQEINGLIDRFASQYGVNPHVLRRIAICESGFNPKAKNGPYAGLFQFSSSTWSNNRLLIGEDIDSGLRYNAEEATQTAAYMLSQGKGYSWPNCLP